MPIDASVVSRLIQPQIQQSDPLERYGKSLVLKNLMGAGDLQALQFESAQRDVADDRATREAYIGGAGDPAKVRERLAASGSYKALMAHDKNTLEGDAKRAAILKDKAAAGKSTFEVERDQLQHGAALLNEAKDPQSFATVLRVGALTGVFKPEFVAKVSEQGYSPQLVESLKSAGLTRAQQLDAQHKAGTLAETGRHNLAAEGNAAGQLAVSRGNLGVAQGNLGVSRDRLAMERDQPRGMIDADRGLLVDPRTAVGRPITVDGAPVGAKEKLTDGQKKELASIDSQASQVQGALASVKANRDAFGLARGAATMAGAVPESLAGRMDTDAQRQARSYVFNVVSKVINERAGAAQSAQELARLRSFLPAETDNADQIESKLTGYQQYLADSRAGYDKPQTPGSRPEAPKTVEPKMFNTMPDPAKYSGKRIESDDGSIYKSDGKRWLRQ